MMRHLTRADYRDMPWANGRGTTIEILRRDDAAGMIWRFSMATVAEDGPFSHFPGIERNLTVIDGPGFDLVGDARFRADPLRPVAFPGDITLSAHNVSGLAVDFNVMTRKTLPRPHVDWVQSTPMRRAGATLCLFALDICKYGSTTMARHDFLWNAPAAELDGTALAIHLYERTV